MAAHKYSFPVQENMAAAVGRDLPISKKHAVEVCAFVRGKPVSWAKQKLEAVLDMKQAVPYRRHNTDLAHKSTTKGPGRYPLTTAKHVLALVKSAEQNAKQKGLSTVKLEICHINAHQAATRSHNGSRVSGVMKRSHVEVVVREALTQTKKAPAAKKPTTKAAKKTPAKAAATKESSQ